jgi:hypothetical protein
VGPKLFMRSGVIISAVGHVAALLLAVLFTGANPFDSVATEAIAVDIISPSEVPPDQPQAAAPEKTPEPARESPPEFNFELGMSTTPLPPTPPASSSTTKPAQQAAQPRAKDQQSARQPAAQAAAAAQTAAPPPAATAAQSAAKPQPAQPPPLPPPDKMQFPAAQEADKEASQPTTVADLFGMPLTLPDGRLGGGFDAPAYESAKIERSSVDAFRARLKTCAALPAGVSPSEKISLVVRVQLKPDGTLAGKPTLIEASASPKGPLLLQSLLGGLAKCQPYNMLPADKYQEWKSIDMRFTPNDMG